MFTGLITHTARVRSLEHTDGCMRLELENPFATSEPVIEGESIAVNGCCLTALKPKSGAAIEFFVSNETRQRTAFEFTREGDVVNLERSLSLQDRLGGHLVSGHVDCVGQVDTVTQDGDSYRVSIHYPARFGPLVITKGSITIDGVSMTVNELDDATAAGWNRFVVNVIPHTWNATNLARLASGSDRRTLNLEFDMFGKYVRRYQELTQRSESGTQKQEPGLFAIEKEMEVLEEQWRQQVLGGAHLDE